MAGAEHQDMMPHMTELFCMAAQCKHVTEFGVRTGNSTVAILAGMAAGGGGHLVSYDITPQSFVIGNPDPSTWEFRRADTGTLPAIEKTDMLFVDTLHTDEQVAKELIHAGSVRRYLVFHDVVMFGWRGESDDDGILKPIFHFMSAHPEWRVHHFTHSPWGLLALKKNTL